MRKVVLGVTGSIAAYKACELARLLRKNGDDVHVVMTEAALNFATPLSFATLSQNKVSVRQFPDAEEWKPAHVSLAESADLVVVAPATANTIAKIRHGIADNLLTATVLASRAPLFIAPAMNDGMWENAATRENIDALRKRGATIIEPETGFLACGSEGKGRMAAPERIMEALG